MTRSREGHHHKSSVGGVVFRLCVTSAKISASSAVISFSRFFTAEDHRDTQRISSNKDTTFLLNKLTPDENLYKRSGPSGSRLTFAHYHIATFRTDPARGVHGSRRSLEEIDQGVSPKPI